MNDLRQLDINEDFFMNTDIILNELAKLLEVKRSDLSVNSPIRDWDSLILISMIAIIDEHFGILIKSYEIERFQTIKDIFLFIKNTQKSVNVA